MSGEMIRKGADDPITTKVTPPAYDHGETCAHGLPWVSVDGEHWHREPKSDARHVDVYVPCDPQLELMPKKAKR